MNQYVTGAVIKELREKKNLTQSELATILNVSDKAVSKWETAKGYPDISLLEPIAIAFGISITELLSGNAITNMNVSANMLRSKFYVCHKRNVMILCHFMVNLYIILIFYSFNKYHVILIRKFCLFW